MSRDLLDFNSAYLLYYLVDLMSNFFGPYLTGFVVHSSDPSDDLLAVCKDPYPLSVFVDVYLSCFGCFGYGKEFRLDNLHGGS